ncbi:MAG: ribonuclease III [Candidatus Moranbacteria bacterium]|nr:ribonuclease III [Candidatus Moranbacteria bacterium]
MPISIEELAKKLGVKFENIDLFMEALTHRSYLNEHRGERLDHNERLEFLGDAVLELVVTDYLFNNFKNPEGELTSWRSALVNGEMLAEIGEELEINDYLRMSKGEAKDTGRARKYLIANAMEAIIGSIYLDQGYEAARKFIEENIIIRLKEVLEKNLFMDPKSYFQEKAQEESKITPSYRLIKEWGPDHDKHFLIGVYLGEELVAEGEGVSKQEAQREAAQKGLEEKGWA